MRRYLAWSVGAIVVAALLAPAAQGAEFTASEYPAEMHSEIPAGSQSFTTEAGTVYCDSTLAGYGEEASQTAALHATYSGCEAFGFISVSVNTEECDYVFHLDSEVAEHKYTATVSIVCPEGQSIKITAASCALEIGAQGPLSHGIVEDTTNGIIDMTAEITGINYTVTKDGLFCPFSGTGAKEGGEYVSVEAAAIESDQGLYID